MKKKVYKINALLAIIFMLLVQMIAPVKANTSEVNNLPKELRNIITNVEVWSETAGRRADLNSSGQNIIVEMPNTTLKWDSI